VSEGSGPLPAGPLAGLLLPAPEADGVEDHVARWALGRLGAGTVEAGGPRARLERVLGGWQPAGVPGGTLAYATGLALAGATLAAHRGGGDVVVTDVDVAIQLFLPAVLAAGDGTDAPPAPPAPRPYAEGALCCELGSPGDPERFEALLATLPPGTTAGEAAAAAQTWRLPVTDYRPRRPAPPLPAPAPVRGGRAASPAGPGPGAPLEGVVVCDLTTMWAGPLATWLLGRLGATVWKVEPDIRRDGLRGTPSFAALNSGKRRRALDLTRPGGRDELEALVRQSDVVVDSFSPRVMPNLGLAPDVLARWRPGIVAVSLPAFPPGRERSWVAYGTGAHALSGLGDLGRDGWAAPAVTYPDPLAGLTAALEVLATLVGRGGRGGGCAVFRRDAPLLSAITPLLALSGAGASHSVAERDPETGRRLRKVGEGGGSFARIGGAAPPRVAVKGGSVPVGGRTTVAWSSRDVHATAGQPPTAAAVVPLGPWRGDGLSLALGEVPE
jgi:hypothetical protein